MPRPTPSRPAPPRPRSAPPPLPAPEDVTPDPNATQELSVADLLASHPPPLPGPARVPKFEAESAPATEPEPEPPTPRIERAAVETIPTVSALTRVEAKLAVARSAIVTFGLFVAYAARAFHAFVVASLPKARTRLREEWRRAERRSAR